MNKNIRIGFMGSSCSGKTTTAHLIARDLELELQEEIESRLMTQWILSGKLKDKHSFYPALSKEFQESALKIREINSKVMTSGVSDRTAADLLVYNRFYVQPHFSEQYAIEFTERCNALMRTYSHLFLFPEGVLPLKDNNFRTVNRDYQRKVHKNLLHVLDDLRISYFSLSDRNLAADERMEEIKQCLRI